LIHKNNKSLLNKKLPIVYRITAETQKELYAMTLYGKENIIFDALVDD